MLTFDITQNNHNVKSKETEVLKSSAVENKKTDSLITIMCKVKRHAKLRY